MARVFILISFLWLFTSSAVASDSQNVILNSKTFNAVVSDLSYLNDSLGELSYAQVEKHNGFNHYADSLIHISSPCTYWIKFSVKNDMDVDQDYIFDFENWSTVGLFSVDQNGELISKVTGHRLPYYQRDYRFANKNLIKASLEENEVRTFYARLEYTFNNEKKPSNLNFAISSEELMATANSSEKQWISVFIAIYVIMFFYNLFVYFSTRDEAYLYYLFLLLILMYAGFYNSGMLVSLFGFMDSFPHILYDYIKHILSPLLAIAGIWFTQRFLSVKTRYPKWNKFFNILIVLLWVLIPFQFFAYEVALAFIGLIGMISFIASLIIGIKAVRDKVPSAIYFVIGYFFFISGLLIATYAILGILPKTPFTFSYSMPIGSTIQMVFFSLALADKINFLKKDNIERKELLIAQLKENQSLQTKVNRELEQKVLERTAEIEEQKDEIAFQKDAIEIEKDKFEQLLLNILPKETAEELHAKGKATPRTYNNASVLFTDIVGFTRIAEVTDPNELVSQLDHCFQAFDEIITHNHLEKIKTIGDSYMCAGGLPVADEDNAIRIVKAALEIQEYMDNWNKIKKDKGEQPWELRIGVHSGNVIAGVVGKKKFAYDIWGDTVNLASRMESACSPGKVNVSENTWNLIKDTFNCKPRGKLTVKNKGEIEMYYVEGLNVN